jgi:hypothetical protein
MIPRWTSRSRSPRNAAPRSLAIGARTHLAPRGRRQPVRRRRASRIGADLELHPVANLLIHGLPLEIGPRARVAIERAGPPVEHTLTRVRREMVGARQHRLEDAGRRTRRVVEEQRLAKADDELGPLACTQPPGVDPAQPIARLRQIAADCARAKALEIRARRNEIGAVGPLRHAASLFSGRDRGVELAVVVQEAGARQRVLGLRRRRQRRGQAGQRRGPKERSHSRDGNTDHAVPNSLRYKPLRLHA